MSVFQTLRTASGGGPFGRSNYAPRERYRADYEQLADALCEVLTFDDHLDVGCGQGLLVEPLVMRHGKDCHGVDGSATAAEFASAAIRDRIRRARIDELVADRSYDLVSCVEVLEHIPEAESHAAVAFLTTSARTHVYFSAAIPGQSGTGHINCQPSIFWILAFDHHGFALDLERCRDLRERIAGMQRCTWLPQNALIFTRKT